MSLIAHSARRMSFKSFIFLGESLSLAAAEIDIMFLEMYEIQVYTKKTFDVIPSGKDSLDFVASIEC